MHLSPCAQHSAFCLNIVSQSFLHMYRKKLLQTLHTSGWNAGFEHHCHSAPRHQGCGWHWFFAGLSPKEGNTEIYYSDCWYFSFDFDRTSLLARKYFFRYTQIPCSPSYRNMASSKSLWISNMQFYLRGGRESGTTAAITSLCLNRYHKAQHITVPSSEVQKGRETPRQLGFFTLHSKYTTRIFSP